MAARRLFVDPVQGSSLGDEPTRNPRGGHRSARRVFTLFLSRDTHQGREVFGDGDDTQGRASSEPTPGKARGRAAGDRALIG